MTQWVPRALGLSTQLQPKGLIQEDETSDPTVSPRDRPEQPLLQRRSHTMPELALGVWQGLDGLQ